MKRLLAFVIAAGLATAGCGSDASALPTSPSQPPAAASASAEANPLAKVYSIGGMVMAVEKPTRAVSGARVEVTTGANAGTFVMSDADGSFLLSPLNAGSLSLRISKDGFQTWTLEDAFLDADRKIGAELFRAPPSDAAGVAATGRCNGGAWTWAQTLEEACTREGGLAYGVCPGPLCKH